MNCSGRRGMRGRSLSVPAKKQLNGFTSHPLAERIATEWPNEEEVLFVPEPGEVEIVENC